MRARLEKKSEVEGGPIPPAEEVGASPFANAVILVGILIYSNSIGRRRSDSRSRRRCSA